MAGYTRTDTSNNIADGNVINAADFDGEYDAIQAAFTASTGHAHDGSVGEGKPITKIGPSQDVVVSATTVVPKTTTIVDIGSSALKFKDVYLSGTINGTDSTNLATKTGSETFTNKRITPRVNITTTTASPWAWNSDSYDQQGFTALANALTISADAGTPTDGQKTVLRIKDNGTTRNLTWTTGSSKAFRAVGVTLPTTTVVNKTVYIGCIYNIADSRWDVVAVSQEA